MGERVVLPTPFPVGPVNVWVLRGDPLTLVDAGPRTPEALTTLEAGVASLGLRLEDVQLLVLTHQHHDHVGQAAELRRRSGCAVAAHELLVERLPALREMQAAGIRPFCITVDAAGHDYLREMCDPQSYLVIDHVADLPRELPKIYQRLVWAG